MSVSCALSTIFFCLIFIYFLLWLSYAIPHRDLVLHTTMLHLNPSSHQTSFTTTSVSHCLRSALILPTPSFVPDFWVLQWWLAALPFVPIIITAIIYTTTTTADNCSPPSSDSAFPFLINNSSHMRLTFLSSSAVDTLYHSPRRAGRTFADWSAGTAW